MVTGFAAVFLGLWGAFFLLFVWMARERLIRAALLKAAASVDASVRRRAAQNRRNLMDSHKGGGWWGRVERKLLYSGLAGRFPSLTPEVWVTGQTTVTAVIFLFGMLLMRNWKYGLTVAAVFQAAVWIAMGRLKRKNYESVDSNLLKFLDFLGNYSVTAGEVTGIFNQISRYMEEPLKSALDECYYEAQTSGDACLALLSLADKIEHPRFKELVRNIEISARYSADFKLLVNSSRRAVREHLRTRQERKALLREALVNMALLLGMSLFVLMAVGQLVETDIRSLMLDTFPGKLCLTVMAVIFGLFYRQAGKLDG